jgi:UDP-N-acetylglucosamine 1-carboxyvinyltransferase
MEAFVVTGGKKLTGTVKVSGAKNSALPIITACCLIDGEVTLHNVPNCHDVIALLEIIRKLGAKIRQLDNTTWSINCSGNLRHEVVSEQATKIRGCQTLLGALLSRVGEVKLGQLGGCKIGSRPIDLHLKGFKAMGAQVEQDAAIVNARRTDRLKGTWIFLDFPSVGATENLIIAGVQADGETLIENAAEEPEIVDLAHFLGSCGARIEGAGTKKIRIQGVDTLKPTSHTIIPDRIEAGTFMIASVITGGDITVDHIKPSFLESLLFKFREAGISVNIDSHNRIRVKGNVRPKPINVIASTYPGFPTDLQSQISTMCCIAEGHSIITEKVFEKRFAVIPELVKMGAKIDIINETLDIFGIERFTGATVTSPDLRGGVSLMLAGMNADGMTTILGTEHVDRGYEKIEDKLSNLGGEIKRIKLD